VQVTKGETLTPASRFADSAPFFAGAFIQNDGWDCTTGIPVKDNNNHQFIVTASHCGHTNTQWTNGAGGWVGQIAR
jgi:hypothetical protein